MQERKRWYSSFFRSGGRSINQSINPSINQKAEEDNRFPPSESVYLDGADERTITWSAFQAHLELRQRALSLLLWVLLLPAESSTESGSGFFDAWFARGTRCGVALWSCFADEKLF